MNQFNDWIVYCGNEYFKAVEVDESIRWKRCYVIVRKASKGKEQDDCEERWEGEKQRIQMRGVAEEMG